MAKKTPKDSHGEISKYIKSKRIDSLVGSILEDIIKERPENTVAHAIEFLVRKYPDDTKTTWTVFTNGLQLLGDSKENRHHSAKNPHVSTVNTVPGELQGELADYLEQKQVNQLFVKITEVVLLEKPGQPVVFIFEYLLKTYPEDARVAMDNMNPKLKTFNEFKSAQAPSESDSKGLVAQSKESDSKDNKPTPQTAAVATGSASAQSKKATADADSDVDDEADYLPEEKEAEAQAKPRQWTRRLSVSSESLDVDTLSQQISEIANIPKSIEVANTLYKAVSKSAMLRKMLEPEQRELIVRAFAGPIVKAPGEEIITQGEVGDVFYLVESGTVDVFVKRQGSEQQFKVHTYKAGDAFGQLALMYNAPRAATCRAHSQARLWGLDRTSFKVIIATAALHKREYFLSFLGNIGIFQTLTQGEMQRLADCLTEVKVEAGGVVVSEGEEAFALFIVKEGQAVVSSSASQGENSSVAAQQQQLTVGEFVGELSLLEKVRRHRGTVRAKEAASSGGGSSKGGSLRLLKIDRAAFTRVFGPIEEMLRRDVELFTRYTNGDSTLTHNLSI